MKRWLPAAFVVLALVPAIVIGATGVLTDDDESSCIPADSLREQGRLEQAERRYEAIVDADPTASCARAGLEATHRRACANATDLLDQGLLTAAEQAYATLADSEPRPRCAIEGLRQVTRQWCGRAAQLMYRGRFAVAEAILVERFKSQSACEPRSLRDIVVTSCEGAARLLGKEQIAATEKAYLAILSMNPRTYCAVRGLQRVTRRLCAGAAALARRDPAAAKQVLLGILLERDPTAACALRQLARSNG